MATNSASASFQEIYDVSTKPGSATIIGIHTPTTTRVHTYLHGFFEQFRKFRYYGCSVTVVPVAQLPVDPLQVSYEAGEPGVDPRDIVNPILHRAIHGESLGNQLEAIFNLDLDKQIFDSLDVVDYDPEQYPETAGQLDAMYYAGLSSPQWYKAHVQKGFRRAGIKPMYYTVGTNRQMMPFWAGNDADILDGGEQPGHMTLGHIRNQGVYNQGEPGQSTGASPQAALYVDIETARDNSYLIPQMFAGGMKRLGWLDTLQSGSFPVSFDGQTVNNAGSGWTLLPKLYQYMMIMPPSYKQKMHVRIIIQHYYGFRGFRAMRSPLAYDSDNQASYPQGNDMSNNVSTIDTLSLIGAEAELVTDGVS